MKQTELHKGSMGTAGLVCSICGLFLVPCVLSTLGIIFGAIAINRKEKYGKAALTLGIIGLALWLIILAFFFLVIITIFANAI